MSAPSSPRPGGRRWHQLTSQPRGPPAGLRSIVQPLADLGYMPRRRNKRRSKAREEEGKKEGGRRERVVEAWEPLMPGTHQPPHTCRQQRQLSSGCQAAKSWTECVPGGRGAECGLVESRPTVLPDVGRQEARVSFTQKRTHTCSFYRHCKGLIRVHSGGMAPSRPRRGQLRVLTTCTQTRPELSATSLWAWRGRQQLGAPVTTAPNRADGKWAHGHSPPPTPATNPDPGGTEKTNPSSPRVWPGRCGVLPATDCSCVGNCAHV